MVCEIWKEPLRASQVTFYTYYCVTIPTDLFKVQPTGHRVWWFTLGGAELLYHSYLWCNYNEIMLLFKCMNLINTRL